MVRIVGHKEQPKPQQQQPPQLTHKSNVLLNVIGIIIADNPDAIKTLLADYDVKLPEKADEKEITEQLLDAVSKGNKELQQDLAELILDNTLTDNGYDSFDFKSLLGSGNSSEGQSGGLLSNITGAISNVGASINQGITQRKQASSQTLQGVMAYRQQQLQNEQSKAKMKTQMTLGVLLLLGVCVLAVIGFKKIRQQKIANQLKQIKA